MASVSLLGVAKVFPGRVTAVNHLELEVRDEEFLVLLGPSGCGKSTTLRLIAGLEQATEGEIRIGGRVVNGVPPKDRNIAMVFQNYALYPHMSVYKNMAFGLELRYGGTSFHRIWKRLTNPAAAAEMAVKRRGIRERVRQTAQALGIEPLLDRKPGQLSGGERQRVALGRAIVRQPAVFLFDEPLSNLDAKLRLETRRELKELHRRLRTTMVYVTHDQTEAMTLGERIVVMDQGTIQQAGTPMEVYCQPQNRFVAGFVGSPPMNFIPGRLTRHSERVTFEAFGLRLAVPRDRDFDATCAEGQNVLLGVRPEDVVIEAIGGSVEENRGRVSLVEPLGDITLIHVAIASVDGVTKNDEGEVVLTSKGKPQLEFDRGDAVQVRFDERHLHLFDPVTGRSL